MTLLIGSLIIILLYYRTYRYNLLIDDPVGRGGYLYELAKKVDYVWYDKRRSLASVVINIATYVSTCGYIYIMFGWKAGIMYAVFPLNVSGVAWNTGNYYMSTVLLCMASLYWIPPGLAEWGQIAMMALSLAFYTAALNSTLIALPFGAISLFYPLGYCNIFPLLMFLTGKRLRVGISKRRGSHDSMGVESGFRWKNFYHVPRVLAYYIFLSCYPVRLGFFHSFGKKGEHQTWRWWWISWLVIISFFVWGISIDWKAGVFWFLSIGVFGQFIIYGQFVTERYTHLANVWFCVLMSKFLPYELFWVVCTLYFCKSLLYIPVFKSNERLFGHSATQFPEAGENWVNFGSYYIERGKTFEAIKPLLLAERLVEGDKYGVYVDLANCYAQNGFFQKALEWTEKALGVATKDKVGVMTEQRDDLERKVYKMQIGNRELKRMGVI
jgi:hypothetical protein